MSIKMGPLLVWCEKCDKWVECELNAREAKCKKCGDVFDAVDSATKSPKCEKCKSFVENRSIKICLSCEQEICKIENVMEMAANKYPYLEISLGNEGWMFNPNYIENDRESRIESDTFANLVRKIYETLK